MKTICKFCGKKHSLDKLWCLGQKREKLRTAIRGKAASMVAREIKAGRLPAARKCKCADCGKQAQCYDHRDYRKPLIVDPVCYRCDAQRGAGAPYDGYDKEWKRRMEKTTKRLITRQAVHKTLTKANGRKS